MLVYENEGNQMLHEIIEAEAPNMDVEGETEFKLEHGERKVVFYRAREEVFEFALRTKYSII